MKTWQRDRASSLSLASKHGVNADRFQDDEAIQCARAVENSSGSSSLASSAPGSGLLSLIHGHRGNLNPPHPSRARARRAIPAFLAAGDRSRLAAARIQERYRRASASPQRSRPARSCRCAPRRGPGRAALLLPDWVLEGENHAPASDARLRIRTRISGFRFGLG